MGRSIAGLLIWLLAAVQVCARQEWVVCGTTREKLLEQLQLHRQSERLRRELVRRGLASAAARQPAAKDIGEIAVIDDSDGVVARLNEFNLDGRTLAFAPATPEARRYRFTVSGDSYDAAAASAGTRQEGLADDDTRQVALEFTFSFFGVAYQQVFINSDGNLTFTAGDSAITARSLGRMTAGPPRISALFRDLDPSKSSRGVTVWSAADRFVVSWAAVPEYRDLGVGPLQTFQIRLYPGGRIEFAYAGISTSGAVVGISPGRLEGSSSVVSFLQGSDQEYSATVAERFGRANEVDVVTAAQKFYGTHEDAYDYLVFFNTLGVEAGEGAVSYEMTVRSSGHGFGDVPIDVGVDFGSPRRLRAVLNMGPLGQFPDDPTQLVPGRQASRDTPITVLAHEAGHLFLAYASVRDPDDASARPMLGYQAAHWAFTFNSEASLLEGNRISDRWETQPGISPRFATVAVTEGFSPLDQYLMGLRPSEEPPATFLATGTGISPERHPQMNVYFEGGRRDIAVEEVIRAEGRRTPDHTVAQRRFRFAFILIAPAGADPSPSELAKLDTFRREFETYFRKATGERAWADATLRRALRLSTFPAAGVLAGGTASASLTLERPAEANLAVSLRAANSLIRVPSSVTIPAGAKQAGFTISGLQTGVDELVATPADSRYESAFSRIQVARSAADLKLVAVSGQGQAATPGAPLPQPVVVAVTDINELPYPGLRLNAVVSSGGSVSPASAVTGEDGTASFRWVPGSGPLHQLTASLEGAPSASVTVSALGRPYVAAGGVVNAASYRPGLCPGALATIFGVNLAAGRTSSARFPWPETLAGVTVTLNGKPAPLLFVSDFQINLLAPSGLPEGTADLVVATPLGATATVRVPVEAVSPGIFFDPATNLGAIRVVGDFVEIYSTGLGPVHAEGGFLRTDLPPQVFIGQVPASEITYSGLAPGWLGVYQVNARVSESVPSGIQPLVIVVGGKRSNEAGVRVR